MSRRSVLVGSIALIGAALVPPRRCISTAAFFSDGTNFCDGLA